jgi:small conductance mechanosensitive channel
VDVQVAYKHDTDEVVEVITGAARELESSERHGPMILAPLEVLGVEEFGDSSVTIRVRIKTAPLMQWDISREFRRRLKKAFDAAGIEIPFPQRAITVRHLGEGRPEPDSFSKPT